MMTFWILLLLLINGVVAFAYSASNTTEPAVLWAMLSTVYIYYLGITQAGIIFSGIMRIAKSEWGRQFSRLGEILTLSFIPVAFIMFFIIYAGGSDHLFWWATPEAAPHGSHGGEHAASPWLSKQFFLWRTLISAAAFYIISYVYFAFGRREEKGIKCSCDLGKTINILAGFVMFFYAATSTNTAWDFGMMIIKHWESTVFPPYFWVGGLFSGFAFMFVASIFFIPREPGADMDKEHLDSFSKLLMGFTLLWIYMYWSQHIVINYSDMPSLTEPVLKASSGNYGWAFFIMLLFLFIVPFLAFLFRKVKLCTISLAAVSIIICIGMLINRYLMVVPVFSDGSESAFWTYTGISLIFAGLSATVLSFKAFRRLFPGVTVTTEYRRDI